MQIFKLLIEINTIRLTFIGGLINTRRTIWCWSIFRSFCLTIRARFSCIINIIWVIITVNTNQLCCCWRSSNHFMHHMSIRRITNTSAMFKATDTNANLCIIAIPYGTSPIIGLTKPIPTCPHRFIQASYGDIPFFNTSSKINRIKALMVKSFRLRFSPTCINAAHTRHATDNGEICEWVDASIKTQSNALFKTMAIRIVHIRFCRTDG